jgi:hypothetical protein
MFIAELNLYVNYLKELMEDGLESEQLTKLKKQYDSFYKNIFEGINYYHQLSEKIQCNKKDFINSLNSAKLSIEILYKQLQYS